MRKNWKKRKKAVSAIAIALAFMCMAQEMLCTVRADAAELPSAESVRELAEEREKALKSAEGEIHEAQKGRKYEGGGESSGMLPGKSKGNGISDAARAHSGEEEPDSGISGESVRYAGKKLKLNKKSLKLTVGESATLKVSGTSKKAKWSSSNKKVATVSAKGVVTAKKAGTAKITAKVSGKKLTCSVTVKETKKPLFSASTTSLVVEGSGSVKITYQGDGDLWYENSNPDVCFCAWEDDWYGDVATLNVDGLKRGNSTITITNSEDDRELTINVTVEKPVDQRTEKEKIRDYILENGTTTEDGTKAITWERQGDLGELYAIEYVGSKNMLTFWAGVYDENITSVILMDLPLEDTSGPLSPFFLAEQDNVDFEAMAEIWPATYINDRGASFQFLAPAGCPADLRELVCQAANSVFKLAMQSWDLMLKKYVGSSMREIGFSSF